MLENQAKIVFLGIGSNLGSRKKNIEKAKFYLDQNDLHFISTSNYYETPSWPNPKNPKFLNIVLKISTKLKPIELIKKCKQIEIKIGRKKNKVNSPRECDIDLIDFNKICTKEEIILPHPRMHLRNFVLLPLFEIDKSWKHPESNINIVNLINSLPVKDLRSIKQI